MRRSRASPSLAARLATACANGNFRSTKAAIAGGASVNEPGEAPDWALLFVPLAAAVYTRHDDLAVWLLSHGADPNGDKVMHYGAGWGTVDILRLLIDAGGDVNRESGGEPPLFSAVMIGSVNKVRVLLAQPSLDLTITDHDQTPEQCARDQDYLALADIIVQEVSGRQASLWNREQLLGLTACGVAVPLADRETRCAGTTTALFA